MSDMALESAGVDELDELSTPYPMTATTIGDVVTPLLAIMGAVVLGLVVAGIPSLQVLSAIPLPGAAALVIAAAGVTIGQVFLLQYLNLKRKKRYILERAANARERSKVIAEALEALRAESDQKTLDS